MKLRRRWKVLLAPLALGLIGLASGCGSNGSAVGDRALTGSPTSHVHTLVVISGGRLLLGDQDGLWQAQAGGKRWTRFGPPLAHLMPLCVARWGKIMLACSTGLSKNIVGKPKGLWRSIDGGQKWQRTSLPDLSVIAIATNAAVPDVAAVFAPADSPTGGVGHGGIWVTTDTGKTWTRVNRARALDAMNGLALLPGKPFTILFENTQTIWRSSDGGRSWHPGKGLVGHQPLSLTVSQHNHAMVFAGLEDGVWLSTDAGATWRLQWSGGPTPVLAAAADRTDDIYAYMGGKLSRIDGSRRTTGSGISGQPAVVAVDPTDASRAYAAYSFPLRIYETTNGGRTWSRIL